MGGNEPDPTGPTLTLRYHFYYFYYSLLFGLCPFYSSLRTGCLAKHFIFMRLTYEHLRVLYLPESEF
jgi:hypothetical protein